MADGGGVRGLSALYVLKQLMTSVAPDNSPPALPCEYFDLIAGASTGGLIAVMLGPLRMDVNSCIQSYLKLAPRIFPLEGPVAKWSWSKNLKVVGGISRFNADGMEAALKELIVERLGDRAPNGEDTVLCFESDPPCKV